MKAGNEKLTLSVNKEVKDSYKKICDSEGLKIGKQIELFMHAELVKRGKLEQSSRDHLFSEEKRGKINK